MTDKFRPSNGDARDIFLSSNCYKCSRFRFPCEILGRMFGLDTDHPEYPPELTYDAQGQPTCTAFRVDDGSNTPEPTRCPVTKDMFG